MDAAELADGRARDQIEALKRIDQAIRRITEGGEDLEPSAAEEVAAAIERHRHYVVDRLESIATRLGELTDAVTRLERATRDGVSR